MPASFKIGDKVRQKLPAPVEGTVIDMGVHEGELGFRIACTDGDGNVTERVFAESQLEKVSG